MQENNIPDTLAGFNNFTMAQVSAISSLQLWVILFTVNYLIKVLITQTNLLSEIPTNLREMIVWFGSCYYMV